MIEASLLNSSDVYEASGARAVARFERQQTRKVETFRRIGLAVEGDYRDVTSVNSGPEKIAVKPEVLTLGNGSDQPETVTLFVPSTRVLRRFIQETNGAR